MKSNKRKQQLLDKKFEKYLDENQQIEQIQMQNLKPCNGTGAKYMKLQDEGNDSHFYRNNPRIETKIQSSFQRTFVSKPILPCSSSNCEPNKIVINGLTFVHTNAIKGSIKTQVKQKRPEMEVMCETCYSMQMVPANTHSFICYSCESIQKCTPQFGIFICGSCERQVWYAFRTSLMIKCTKCGTVNNVPQVAQNQVLSNPNPYMDKNMSGNSLQQIIVEQQNSKQRYVTVNYPYI